MAKKKGKGDEAAELHEWVGLDTIAPYADLVRLNIGARGMMITFGQLLPDLKQVRVVGRVVMPPETAGEMLTILRDQVAQYEVAFGKITPDRVSGDSEGAHATDE